MKIHMTECPAHPMVTDALLSGCWCRSGARSEATLSDLLWEFKDTPMESAYARELLAAIVERYNAGDRL